MLKDKDYKGSINYKFEVYQMICNTSFRGLVPPCVVEQSILASFDSLLDEQIRRALQEESYPEEFAPYLDPFRLNT